MRLDGHLRRLDPPSAEASLSVYGISFAHEGQRERLGCDRYGLRALHPDGA